MGIDILSTWAGQTEAEVQAQHHRDALNDPAEAGGLGRLREGWEAFPLPSLYLMWEGYAASGFEDWGARERMDREFDEVKGLLEEAERTPLMSRVILDARPDFGPDPRVEAVTLPRDHEADVATAYPSDVLRERLPLAKAIAHFRECVINPYSTSDRDTMGSRALSNFVALAERLDAEGRGPLLMYTR